MHKMGVTATVTAIALTITGCPGSGIGPNRRAPSAAPAQSVVRQLTRAEAEAVVKKWIEVTNLTRKRRSPGPLSSIESGSALRIDRAHRTMDRKQNQRTPQLKHFKTRVEIPRMTAHPR
jgi:hypothetical protein